MPNVDAARQQIEDLEPQRRRVVRGLVDGSLPPDLAREEQDRIRRETTTAKKLLAAAEMGFADIERLLMGALELVGPCHELYVKGGSRFRRLCNQAFFHQLRVREVEIDEAKLTEPWRSFNDRSWST